MNIARSITRTAAKHPRRPCVYEGAQLLHTYAAFADRVSRLAGGLRARARTGDRVALVMGNRPEYLELLFAIWWAGLVAVPINAKLHPREAAYIIGHCGAGLVLCDESWEPELRRLPGVTVTAAPGPGYDAYLEARPLLLQPRAPEDLAWIFYTSGTTGRPKGARLSHGNLHAMSTAYTTAVETVSGTDRYLYAAPMSHGAGLYAVVFMDGGAAHVLPPSGRFDPAEVLATAAAHGNVTLFAAPTMVKRLVREAAAARPDPGVFRTIVYGGAPMYVDDLRQAMRTLGGCLAQIYGQGEAPMTISTLSKADHRLGDDRVLGSAGRPFPSVTVRLCDEDGREVPPGTPGEVLVKGDVVMSGYWEDEEATRRALRGGWLRTGDIGVLEDGFLTLLDRSKDVIISGGSNVYPREVEEVLQAHPGVAAVSVVGEPDPEWGERVVAYVVPEPGAELDEADLDRHCLAALARFKRPRAYHVVGELPTSPYGKILKKALRSGA